MKAFLKSTAFRVLVIVLLLLALGSVLAGFLPSGSTPANSVVSAVFSPLQSIAAMAAERLNVFALSFRSASVLAEENARLAEENAKIKEELVDYAQAKEKIELYEAFYELKSQNDDYKPVAAAVVGRAPDGGYGVFTLNRGTAHGIKVGCPVVYGKNLIGTVAACSANSSTVNTLLNPELNVGAYALNSAEELFTTTDPELAAQGLCKAPGLTAGSMLAANSVICTSGVTGKFPRGLIIGTVTEILDDPTSISAYAVIAPGTLIAQVRDVIIITAFDGMEN
ncbi:MAG: rod shape-determining protein MreC [Oscillospiraceae bacterium]|jgi:rod shape-determining protein MreC|nr:rod shape-determining protein MreC [Oscillospiraceae bacterium]